MTETVATALADFRRAHGLADNEETRRIWLATLGVLIVPLPNFRWRREIIALHDAHHLLTGYPLDLKGELCLATWELGVGCYADWRARALCIGLALLGLLVTRRETIAAYRAGRGVSARYKALGGQGALLGLGVGAVRAVLRRDDGQHASTARGESHTKQVFTPVERSAPQSASAPRRRPA